MKVFTFEQAPFRGKDVVTQKNVYGYLYDATPLHCCGEGEPKELFILVPGFADWEMPRPVEPYRVYPESVGVNTGLKVVNTAGEKLTLYTGEKVRLKDYHGVREVTVKQFPSGGAFFYGGDGYSDEYLSNAREIVVLGEE